MSDIAPTRPAPNLATWAIVAVAVITLVAAAATIIPARAATASATAVIASAQADVNAILGQLAAADAPGAQDLTAALQGQTAQLSDLLPIVDTGLGVDPVELQLADTLIAAGYQLVAQERGAAVDAGTGVGYVPVDLTAAGPAAATPELLTALTALPRIITIDSPAVRIADDQTATIDLQLRIWHRTP